jgi:hypothetical protein
MADRGQCADRHLDSQQIEKDGTARSTRRWRARKSVGVPSTRVAAVSEL